MPPSLSVSERRARRLARKSGQPVSPQGPQGVGSGGSGDLPIPGASQSQIPSSSSSSSFASTPIPHQAITDSASPLASGIMAQGDEPIVRGNSNLQPLNRRGHDTASRVGQSLARLGGPDQIVPSGARRTVETAQDVSGQTGTPVGQAESGLESHALGNLEGEPRTPEMKRYMAALVKNQPNMKIPGQGAMSNRPGESFNEFRVRALTAVRGLMQRLAANPTQRILVPISTQVIRLVEAWAALGCPDDLGVSPDEFLKEKAAKPGDIVRFVPGAGGKWGITPFNPAGAKEFPPGIYFMRHGETDSVQEAKAAAHQKASAQLVAHVRAGKYKEARDTAKHAIGNGLLSEEDAGNMVDLALPNANDAERLPPDQLLSAVSAAEPQKQQELWPVLQRKLGTMSEISPEGRQAIKTHLGRIKISMSPPNQQTAKSGLARSSARPLQGRGLQGRA